MLSGLSLYQPCLVGSFEGAEVCRQIQVDHRRKEQNPESESAIDHQSSPQIYRGGDKY